MPGDPDFQACKSTSFAAMHVDTEQEFDPSGKLHEAVRHALARLYKKNLFHHDIVATGSAVSATFVTRILVGRAGMTYHYQRLRLFACVCVCACACVPAYDTCVSFVCVCVCVYVCVGAPPFSHIPSLLLLWDADAGAAVAFPLPPLSRRYPWEDALTKPNSPLRVIRDLNDRLRERALPLLKADARARAVPQGSCDFSITLINRMEPADKCHVVKLRPEPKFGLGLTSVSWHADSSLQPHSTIGMCVAVLSVVVLKSWSAWLFCFLRLLFFFHPVVGAKCLLHVWNLISGAVLHPTPAVLCCVLWWCGGGVCVEQLSPNRVGAR